MMNVQDLYLWKRIETEFALFRLVEDSSKEGSENVLVFKARFFFLLRRPWALTWGVLGGLRSSNPVPNSPSLVVLSSSLIVRENRIGRGHLEKDKSSQHFLKSAKKRPLSSLPPSCSVVEHLLLCVGLGGIHVPCLEKFTTHKKTMCKFSPTFSRNAFLISFSVAVSSKSNTW